MHLQTTHKTPQSEASPAMDSTISTASSSSATAAAAPSPAHCDVRQFHGLITCGLCQGYMIDPTTVDYCYHTYCRSCILKHLLRVAYCPQCKASGGKEISEINLRSDDTLRSLIYKLVPGLYRRECDQLVDFKERHRELLDADDQQSVAEPEFFTSADLVSLSLEYHPAMLEKCMASEVPPIIYLQCPAGLKVELLRRFLCSKYNIDAENKLVEVEVTYEDEVLPSSFTLMDVGYCYKWTGHAPMAFCYRIMVYESERAKNDENNLSKINNQDVDTVQKVRRSKSGKTVTFAEDLESDMDSGLVSGSPRAKGRSNKSAKASPPPKAKRLATAKRELEDSSSSSSVSSFKSLRSNDMRYCDYGVARVKSEPEPEPDAAEQPRESALPPHMNIVVSIPPSQLSCYVDEGDFELKTANKKGNLPKLKIELNSMRSKLSMPMSAEPRLEDTSCSVQQLDLETYAKNIGLKPIEPTHSSHCAPAVAAADSKYSPNASPMSSCSTSTNGSGSGSNGLGIGDASMPATSTPIPNSSSGSGSHRKRKKKHSKEPKDANGKRKKLHAEISSQTDGKMKVKITSNPTNNHHKAHKLDLKRSHSLAGGELGLGSAVSFSHLKLDETRGATSDALNRTLGEESRSISSLMTGAPTPPPTPTAETEATKMALVAKELALPASPPLPPSLFKAFTPAPAPAAVPTPSPTTAAPAPKPKQQQHQQQPAKAATKPPLSTNNNRKPSQLAAPGGHFVVPQPPTHANRNMYHMQRYLSTPSSIASSANKQPKRSVSVDESMTGGQAKQARLQQVQAMTSYAARFQMQANGNGPKVASASYQPNPQMRLYGPEMAKQQALPIHCPASISMSLPGSSLSSGSVTITPRGRPSQQMPYSFPEPASHVPALEIVRLGPSKQAGAVPKQPNAMMTGGRIMGPPAALPKQNQNQNQGQSQAKGQGPKRAAVHSPPMPMPLPLPMSMPMPMPMPIPAIVKSPPLSVALSGQRGSSHNYNNHKSKSNNNNSSSNNKNNNAAYRASPPALINLRNTVPLPFPSKSSAKVDANSKKSPPAAAAGTGAVAGAGAAGCIGGGSTGSSNISSSSNSQSKTNGTAALDPSKTGLREFRPPFGTALPAAAATTTAMTTAPAIVAAAAALAKDADILDLSANPGRSSNSNNSSSTTTKLAGTNRAPTSTSPPAGNISTTSNSSNSSSSSLEAALNKIKQNISANSNSNGNGNGGGLTSGAAAATTTTGNGNITTTSSSMSSSSSGTATTTSTGTGDDLQNLHLLSESATAREKISIKSGGGGGGGGSNIFENKPKNGNAVVRPQNASVRSIPNPSALAFRNQTTLPAAATAAATVTAATASMASAITKPLTVKAEEKPKMSSTTAPGLLSPTGSNGSSHSSSGCSAAATSPRALTKKPTTIDQVAANLNIRAEAKAAALAEEAPLVLTTSSSKSPELAKTTAAVTVPAPTAAATAPTTATTAVTSQPEIAIGPKSELTKETAITVSAASTLLSLPTAAGIVSQSEALPKPPVQIAATDTLAPVASSA